MNRCRYIVIEGLEGVGKTTQASKLADYLTNKGFKVLSTKEPGTPHSPLSLALREIMLDKKYDDDLTPQARELICQAIRSMHVDKIIKPALETHDFIIQDRGMLSGLAYGYACGNSINDLISLLKYVTHCRDIGEIGHTYDSIIYLTGDVSSNLNRALSCKNEFESGDVLETKGRNFLDAVKENMGRMSLLFNTITINVDDKRIDEVFDEMLKCLDLNMKDDAS